MSGFTAIDIRNVPDDIVRAVNADAEDQNRSVADTVLAILGETYDFPVELSGYPYLGTAGSNHWNIRVPVGLRDAIKAHAKQLGGTILGTTLLAVAQAYDIPYSAQRRTPSRLTPMMVADLRRRNRNGESIRTLAREVGVKRETLSRAIRD